MRRLRAPIVLTVAFLLVACGESDEEKAQKAVCDARASIAKQVDELKSLTPQTVSADAVTSSLSAIRDDLSKIKNAQADLSDDRRQQVQSANDAFSSQVQGTIREVVSSGSAADAKTQLTSALQQLAASYEQAFARVDCS
jgi:hypothetical protein